jgi:hypothetical protein
MKLRKPIWFCLLAWLSACEPIATFEKPQPENTRNSVRIPQKLAGTYRNAYGNTFIFITNQTVTRQQCYEERTHQKDLDSTVVLQGGFLVDLATKARIKVTLIGDSVVQREEFLDTLLNLAGDDVLKKFKGRYFLNQKYGEKSWGVTSLAFRKGALLVQTIATPEELVKLKAITNITSDCPVIFNPTKKQFREFLKQNGFRTEETFFRFKEAK